MHKIIRALKKEWPTLVAGWIIAQALNLAIDLVVSFLEWLFSFSQK